MKIILIFVSLLFPPKKFYLCVEFNKEETECEDYCIIEAELALKYQGFWIENAIPKEVIDCDFDVKEFVTFNKKLVKIYFLK